MRCIDLNNDFSLLLQRKIERGKRYSTSIENIRNEKSYTRRKNRYF